MNGNPTDLVPEAGEVTVALSEDELSFNVALHFGGGFFLTGHVTFVFDSLLAVSNSAEQGGVAYCITSQPGLLEGTTFTGNQARTAMVGTTGAL